MAAKTVSLHLSLGSTAAGFKSAGSPSAAHFRVMRHFSSPLLLGPEPSEKLLSLIMHLFSGEEAELVQHLGPLRPRSARKIASLSGRSKEEAERLLDFLAFVKRVILAYGNPRKYTLLPIVPGTFEMALMTPDLSTRNVWHRRFAELFVFLWVVVYIVHYTMRVLPGIRYLPVSAVSVSLSSAWPSERLEEILAPYSDFAVGNCQCRVAMALVGKGCGRPLENCVVMGPNASRFIERGRMRRTDAQEVLALKREAEESGCVSWINNDVGGQPRGNSSCSCCGCCCHAMRSISQFNSPGMIARPHFYPSLSSGICVGCGKCANACPMGALSMIGSRPSFDSTRCIGCGLCVTACRVNAISLSEVKDPALHRSSGLGLFFQLVPGYLSNAFRVWLGRKTGFRQSL